MPAQLRNAGTWKGITEGGAIPTALAPDTAETQFSLVEFVGIYDITWKLIQDARNSEYAFERAVSFMDNSIKRRIFRLLNADVIDNGLGRLGVFSGADDQTTVSLNSLPLVEAGLVVDVIDASDDSTKLEDSATVTAVNVITNEVTLSGAPAGTAAGDYIVIEDSVAGAASSRHLHGLLGIVDDADPPAAKGDFGFDRGTAGNEFWESAVLSNSGTNRPLTEDLVIQACDYARAKGGGNIDKWIMNQAIARRYHEMLRSETHYALSREPGTLGGGLGRDEQGGQKKPSSDKGRSPYEISAIPVHVDPYFRANTVVGLDTSTVFLGVGENELPRPISEIFPDVPFFKETANATFEVVWYWQGELLCDNPAANVKIEDVAES